MGLVWATESFVFMRSGSTSRTVWRFPSFSERVCWAEPQVWAGRKSTIRNVVALEESLPAQHCCIHRNRRHLQLQAAGLGNMVFGPWQRLAILVMFLCRSGPMSCRCQSLNCSLPSIFLVWRLLSTCWLWQVPFSLRQLSSCVTWGHQIQIYGSW